MRVLRLVSLLNSGSGLVPRPGDSAALAAPHTAAFPSLLHASVENDAVCMQARGLHLSLGWPPQGVVAAPETHQHFCPHCAGFLTIIIYYSFKWKGDCSVLDILAFSF